MLDMEVIVKVGRARWTKSVGHNVNLPSGFMENKVQRRHPFD